MSLDTPIKYQILKSKPSLGEGSITDIKNKTLNRCFKLISTDDHDLHIQLRLQAPSIVTEINLRLIHTQNYEITLIDSKNNPLEEIKKKNVNQGNQNVVIPNTTQPIRYVKVTLSKSPYSTQRLGIRYIIFKGINEEQQQKKPGSKIKPDHSKGSLKLDSFYNVEVKINLKNDQRTTESKQMFNTRQKSKSFKENVDKLLDFTQFNDQFDSSKKQRRNQSLQKSQTKPKKKVNRDKNEQNFYQLSNRTYQKYKRQRQQRENTQIAIALSKSVQPTYQDCYEKMEIQQELPVGLQNYFNQKINTMELEEQGPMYRTVDYHEDYIALFSDMSPEWFHAQRKAQIQNNVREEQRLTNYVKIKWLYDTEIYISGFEGWRMDELHHQARILGCRIIDSVKNNCLAIVTKGICEKLIKKHKQWKEIKYLNANYLQDCINKKQKLGFRQYYLNA